MSRRTGQREHVLRLVDLLLGRHIHFHVHRLDHVQSPGGRIKVTRHVTFLEYLGGVPQPGRGYFGKIPEMLVGIHDGKSFCLLAKKTWPGNRHICQGHRPKHG